DYFKISTKSREVRRDWADFLYGEGTADGRQAAELIRRLDDPPGAAPREFAKPKVPPLVLTTTRWEYVNSFIPWLAKRWRGLASLLGERFLRWVYAPVREEVGRMTPSQGFWKSTLPLFLILAVSLVIFPSLNSLHLSAPQ